MNRRLIIEREAKYFGCVRKLTVLVNGKKIVVIANGERREIELADDAESVSVRMDWCQSDEFRLEKGRETFNLKCKISDMPGVLWECFLRPKNVFRLVEVSDI